MKNLRLFFHGTDSGTSFIFAILLLGIICWCYLPYALFLNQKIFFEKQRLEKIKVQIVKENNEYEQHYKVICDEVK